MTDIPPMFTPFRLREMETPNRVMVSPMCQFAADDGLIGDWHIAHLGSFAVGGAGIVCTEMTDVSPEGRISPGCAGMYKREHVGAWKRVVDFVHGFGTAKIAIQLAHAGAKASTRIPWEREKGPLTPADGGWQVIGPSAVPFEPDGPVPKEMDRADMDRVIGDFARGAEMADQAGFDMIELHGAHGYLLSAFLSPLMNQRTDDYGGALVNRVRFPLEVFDAVRAAWPAEKPICIRLSTTDSVEGGQTVADTVDVAKAFRAHGCDIIDCSAGGTKFGVRPAWDAETQIPIAAQIRRDAGIPTIAVGGIVGVRQVNQVIAEGKADICALGRMHLTDPHFTLRAAAELGYHDQFWPVRYRGAKMQAEALAEAAARQAAE